MHNLTGLGTASLDTMGGLVTNVAPSDLPEGASPRTWDTDFIVGSVFTRAGLSSVYAYATTFNITAVSVSYGVATFTYAANLATPTVNETFLLSAFTGLAFPLNGQIITVTFVNAAANQFNAVVSGILNMSQIAQAGFAVSTVGSFDGPKTPTSASQGSTGTQWTNPSGILGSISYAQVVLPSASAKSSALAGQAFAYAIPSTSGITGLITTFQAYASVANVTLTVQMLKAGTPVGTPKTQLLTTTPTIYSLGASSDLWNGTWVSSDVNNVTWGVQFSASGAAGTVFLNDVDTIVYVSPALTNFNYIKSYIQQDTQTYTLALDATGDLWREDVTNNPGYLTLVLSGLLPNSFAKSTTMNDREFICFSDLLEGTDRPRIYDGTQFGPLSQVGPGAAPQFNSSVGNNGQNTLTLTNFQISGDVVTFTYTGTEPTAGQLFTITGVAAPYAYLNITATILGTGLSPTQFQMGIQHADVGSTAISGIATQAFQYNISTITQPVSFIPYPTTNFNGQIFLWSAGPGSTQPGTTITAYYGSTTSGPDPGLVAAVNAGLYPVYVYIQDAPFANGTWLVTSVGFGNPPGEHPGVNYFTFTYTQSGYQKVGGPSGGGNTGTYRMTAATVTTTTPIPNVAVGDSLQIFGASPSQWNGSWTVLQTLKSGTMNIVSTAMSSSGVATYGFIVSSGVAPAVGELVTVINCTNNAIFNTTGVIASVSGSFFTISGFSSGAITQATEQGAQAETFGTQFIIDPGPLTVGTTTSPIYGTDTGTGTVATIGGSVVPVGSGTRQAVVFFITNTGYWTAPSPPVTFTTSAEANYINASNIPIGPPNTVARGIAFTEAGQNGVPGANFYVIENPVTITTGNTSTTYSSTIIRDNTTTSAKFTFTDAILLNSTEIDIQGNDLFNQIELGSPAWNVQYAQRMFYGLQLNKVQNFNNLSFDGGYLPNPTGNIAPLGWNVQDTTNTTLNTSPVTGNSLYIFNSTNHVLSSAGLVSQTAFRDAYNVAIIQPNVAYSVRVAARNPSSVGIGTLQITLQDYNSGIGLGTTYGTFQVPLSSMSSVTQVFTGKLLTTPFTGTVSTNLNLVVQVLGLGVSADCEIDRIEVFPTQAPILGAQVFGSYINRPEAIDATGEGGIIDTSSENPQFCYGGFVMHDNLYLLKLSSMYVTEDNSNSEPGGWGLREVSNKVGACGINSYDVGEEWVVTACRAGIFGFNGGQPVKLMQELWNLWNSINWDAGHTIVLRNDMTNRRLLCAVPLPTPNQWLPFDPPNSAPTSPNVILMCNYQGLSTFEELVNSPEVHTTMFGTLAAVDMKRKWSIWRIPTPYMDFIMRQDGKSTPLFVCNGISSSKVYQFLDDQLSDDGVAINGLYTTYGFVNAAKAATLPIFGFHQKRYTVLQFTAEGAGNMQLSLYPNTLNAPYPWSIPGGVTLVNPSYDDWMRPLNVRGNRVFISFSTNAVGSWFELHKILLSGKADSWAPINPTGGGNVGM